MEKYRFIGTEKDSEEYGDPKPKINEIYNSEDIIGRDRERVKYWAEDSSREVAEEWEEVIDNLESTAMRYNDNKIEFSLIDLNSLEDCVKVLAFGAKKYTRNNWQKGFPLTSILNSMMRHISALQKGEMIDPESGLSHIGHIQCNALFLGCKNNTNDLLDE